VTTIIRAGTQALAKLFHQVERAATRGVNELSRSMSAIARSTHSPRSFCTIAPEYTAYKEAGLIENSRHRASFAANRPTLSKNTAPYWNHSK
jgi:hypothetical protein